MNFEKRCAVVTGAAQGIGEAIAKRLYDDGAEKVAILDLNADAAEAAARKIEPNKQRVYAYACNVADEQSVMDCFKKIYNDFGHVDILVNNAGITKDAMFHKMTAEQWDMVIDVNLGGVRNCCMAVVPSMREQEYGRIVNLASVSALGNPGQTNYGASKAAVIGFTKSLAREIGRKNCTANAIAPSYIDTVMLRGVPDEVMARFINAIPLMRLGQPEEVASVAAFLSSDDSSFVNGECIVVSGGSYT